MYCPYCNSPNSATNAFCGGCGKPLGPTCLACSAVNRLDSRYCEQCGSALTSSELSTPAADEMLRALAASGGERKRLTVIFADIINSTGLIERSDPEDAMRRMQPVIDAMKRAVERYDGVVNKVQGDGIMALFGAPPRPHEDHAVRACAAALAMQTGVAALGDADLKIRTGIHTGVVVIQAVQNSFYLTFDVAGSAAHLASRMEQMAEASEILLTGDTLAATGSFVEAQSLGRRPVRGLSEAVDCYRLIRMRHAPASVIFRSRPHLSPLTARKAELEMLEAELASAAKGEAHVVGIAGEAGTGKSRLCFEFAESCRRRGIRVYEARVHSHARALPYQPVLELLRDYLGIKMAQSADEARLQVANAIARLPNAGEALPLLLDFLGLADANQPAPRLDPSVRKIRLIELVRNIVHSGERTGPVVVLVEDLHWIDPASNDFAEAIADAVVGTTTLLLFNFRPSYAAPWMQRSHYRQMALSPLNTDGVADLLSELLGRHSSLGLVPQQIAQRAHGNPFFIEEMIQSLVERGYLEGERGAYRLVREIEAIPMPTTIETLLAARIDHLDEPTKQVLQCAAVIGREVPLTVLEGVAGLQGVELTQALSRLRHAELLRALEEPALYAFSHPLIQEVCYLSLLRDRRRKIHTEVARAVKAHGAGRWDENASLLAYHLEEAGEMMEAAQATIRAALWVGTHDSAQALRSWKKVHQLLATQPRSDSADYLRMQACIQIMTFGWREGLPVEEAQDLFNEAKELALAAGNIRANAWIHAAFGRNLAVRGSADDYVSRVREAASLAKEAKDSSAEVMLKAVLSQALRLAGHLDEALGANAEATRRIHEISDFDRQLFGFNVERWLTVLRGQILVQRGRFEEARPYLDRMLQSGDDLNDITRHLANVAYVDLAWGQGDKNLAVHHADQASSEATSSGSPYVRVNAQACRGLSNIVLGNFAVAIDELEETLSFARRRNTGLEGEGRILADLANAYRLKGDLANARRTAVEAIDVAGKRAARIPLCIAHIVHGEVLLSDGDVDGAALELTRARTLLEETGAELIAPLVDGFAVKIESYGAARCRDGCAVDAP
jgi:adenylate cyclase